MARKQVRIGKDGNVITDGEEGGSSGGRRCGLPSYVDVFGFHLELKHFMLVLVLIGLTMGGVGGEFDCCYLVWCVLHVCTFYVLFDVVCKSEVSV